MIAEKSSIEYVRSSNSEFIELAQTYFEKAESIRYEEDSKPVISTGERMSIYTEEELREMEEEEKYEDEVEDDDVDYDEYDEYYDDDGR